MPSSFTRRVSGPRIHLDPPVVCSRLMDKKKLCSSKVRIQWHPASADRAMKTGSKDSIRIEHQPAALFRRALSSLVSIGRARATPLRSTHLTELSQLPVDPLAQPAPGFDEAARGKPNGFIGDPDVMDTWATSSLTPQIASHWADDPERHRNLFPMDIRPQSHEIIRTWAFYTIVKAYLHEKTVPGTTSSSAGGSSIRTVRKCSRAAATSSPRPIYWSNIPAMPYVTGRHAPGSESTLRMTKPFRQWETLGDQALQRRQVRRGSSLRPRSDDVELTDITEPSIRALSHAWRETVRRAGRNLRLSSSPARCKPSKTFSGRPM